MRVELHRAAELAASGALVAEHLLVEQAELVPRLPVQGLEVDCANIELARGYEAPNTYKFGTRYYLICLSGWVGAVTISR